MKSTNRDVVQQAFSQQAASFENSRMNFSKQEYLNYTVEKLALSPTDHVLEVAAGTCACGRAIAPHAQCVTCLDMTPAMLSVGKTEAEKARLTNMCFVLGDAAELPFLESSFDVVLSRLAFHHFPETARPFAEMVRVLRPGGKLVIIDMEAAAEGLRDTEDTLERMRDPSHVRNLSHEEMLDLYARHGLNVTCCEGTRIPVQLQSWMELTKTPRAVQEQLAACMQEELAGGRKTGFAPFMEDGQIKFYQRWTLVIGERPQETV